MSIEIKQLVIKSTIAEDSDDDARENQPTEALKDEVLGECRRLVMELLDEKGLR